MTYIRKSLTEKANAMGWKVSAAQADQFQTYMELLLEGNEKMNLTAITQPEEVVEKHFLDSLTLLAWPKLKQGAKVIDVGTGAGFPGIPLKIMRPDIDLTLLDGTMKRLNFLGEVCAALKVSARRVHKRAELCIRDSSPAGGRPAAFSPRPPAGGCCSSNGWRCTRTRIPGCPG